MKKRKYFLLAAAAALLGAGALLLWQDRPLIPSPSDQVTHQRKSDVPDTGKAQEKDDPQPSPEELICASGNVLKKRIRTPAGYARIKASPGSLQVFLRNYPMKKFGSPVLLYDGTERSYQEGQAGVFRLPMEKVDLQQCADSVMRMYSEYFWKTKQYDRISFHFVSGFLAEYEKWREGYRIRVNGNDVSWVRSASYDSSYACFQQYLQIVFSYASTLSMEKESVKIDPSQIQAGDVFLKGGSPGHVVMVVDVAQDEKGDKAFLLAQGYMPAQEFHLLENPKHEKDPWYYANELEYPFDTPDYVFEKESLRRLKY